VHQGVDYELSPKKKAEEKITERQSMTLRLITPIEIIMKEENEKVSKNYSRFDLSFSLEICKIKKYI